MAVAFTDGTLMPVLIAFKLLTKDHFVSKIYLHLVYKYNIKHSVVVALLDLDAINFKFQSHFRRKKEILPSLFQ